MKMREGGFTLVELLMVFVIIAILAGMTLIATGMSMDGTEAAKIIGELRSLKSAAIFYYADHAEWPANADVPSLDIYTDRPICAEDPPRYAHITIGTPYTDSMGRERINMGVGLLADGNGKPGIRKRLAEKAHDVGLLESASDPSAPYTGGIDVFINMK
jgi:general secretion pathway protein G